MAHIIIHPAAFRRIVQSEQFSPVMDAAAQSAACRDIAAREIAWHLYVPLQAAQAALDVELAHRAITVGEVRL